MPEAPGPPGLTSREPMRWAGEPLAGARLRASSIEPASGASQSSGAWMRAHSYDPLDWDAPDAGSIELALKRAPANGSPAQRIGSLLVNPGGPGASGIDFVESMVDYVAGDEIRASYDIVGFAPRGVGQSTAVACGDDALVDDFFTADPPMENQADIEAAREKARLFGEACLAATGPLLGEVDTVSAARDMDLIRAVLGDSELYYAGFS